MGRWSRVPRDRRHDLLFEPLAIIRERPLRGGKFFPELGDRVPSPPNEQPGGPPPCGSAAA